METRDPVYFRKRGFTMASCGDIKYTHLHLMLCSDFGLCCHMFLPGWHVLTADIPCQRLLS